MISTARSAYSLGVTGYPLGHSLSPLLHAAALRDTGLPGEYRLYPIAPLPAGQADLEALVAGLRDGRLDGLNVTIPHKQVVIPYLDTLTPLAQHIGAVNTIFCREGRLIGDNTDAPGFLTDLQKQCPQASTPRSALVLGAGGSARAVVYALLSAGWQVAIAARRLNQVQEIIKGSPSFKACKARPNTLSGDRLCMAIRLKTLPAYIRRLGSDQPGRGARNIALTLVVNTTPVGMYPDIERSIWPNNLRFPDGIFVYDLVYNPVDTALVRAARSAGLEAASGLGMLIEQAALAFERWTGIRPSVEAMRQAVVNNTGVA